MQKKMVRFNLRSILVLITGGAVALAVNLPSSLTISSASILPCINISFQNVPDDLSDQIPNTPLKGIGVRKRVTDELLAKDATLTRGWPFTFQEQRGFLYEYGVTKSWFGVPIAIRGSNTTEFSTVALMGNVLFAMCITMLTSATVQAILNCLPIGRKRDQ